MGRARWSKRIRPPLADSRLLGEGRRSRSSPHLLGLCPPLRAVPLSFPCPPAREVGSAVRTAMGTPSFLSTRTFSNYEQSPRPRSTRLPLTRRTPAAPLAKVGQSLRPRSKTLFCALPRIRNNSSPLLSFGGRRASTSVIRRMCC